MDIQFLYGGRFFDLGVSCARCTVHVPSVHLGATELLSVLITSICQQIIVLLVFWLKVLSLTVCAMHYLATSSYQDITTVFIVLHVDV